MAKQHVQSAVTAIVVLVACSIAIAIAVVRYGASQALDQAGNTESGPVVWPVADWIHVSEPQGGVVENPIMVRGEARGSWFFEATFPITVENIDGDVLASHFGTALGEWMTDDFVQFDATLDVFVPEVTEAMLVLHRDNPSGLPEYDAELRIPITIQPTAVRSVSLSFYNPDEDLSPAAGLLCSAQGLVVVGREIPVTRTPIQDTVRLLLRGEITEEERAAGVTTEFPLEGVTLEGVSVADGVLSLEFNDPNGLTSGGACRSGVLWAQVEATARQFDGIVSVQHIPEDIFQP
ncbi:MAG: Gmad2 immunoglobulin-like domain-containing protein [Candidatus Uhrbacteria bacterium]